MSIWRLFATQHWEVPLLIRLQKIGVYHTYPHTVSPFLPNFVIILTERRPSVLYFKPFRSLSTYTRCRQTSPNWAGSALAAGCHAHTRTTSILNEDACKLWSTPDCVGPKLYCFPIPSWWASQSSDVECTCFERQTVERVTSCYSACNMKNSSWALNDSKSQNTEVHMAE